MLAGGIGGVATLTLGAGTAGAAIPGGDPSNPRGLAREVVALFQKLPGTKAMKIVVPLRRGPGWTAELDPARRMIVASSFKGYVLAEALRQAEAALDPRSAVALNDQLAGALDTVQLTVDDSVWVPGSPVLNPPNLTGKVSERTVLEAMISHSDNTATDLALKHAGVDKVRAFIASIGLTGTQTPTSVRRFFSYLGGFPDWETTTWAELIDPGVNFPFRPLFNPVESSISTPSDFVSFYARALTGGLFIHEATTELFRYVLTTSAVTLESMPLGTTPCQKGGSLDLVPDHVLSLAGGTYMAGRWVSFHLVLNWTDTEAGPVAEVKNPFLDTSTAIFTKIRDALER